MARRQHLSLGDVLVHPHFQTWPRASYFLLIDVWLVELAEFRWAELDKFRLAELARFLILQLASFWFARWLARFWLLLELDGFFLVGFWLFLGLADTWLVALIGFGLLELART